MTQKHDFDSVPVLARPGSVIPFGAIQDRPDYPWADDVQLRVFAPGEGQRTRVAIPASDTGSAAEFEVSYRDGTATVDLVSGNSSGWTTTTALP